MSSSDKNGNSNKNIPETEGAGGEASTAAPPAGKDADGKAWDRRISIASCVSFFLGCLWILLFPLVTLTTGESKPRGTFFDENAMLVHHTSTKLTPADVEWAKPARLVEAYPQQVKDVAERIALFQQYRLRRHSFLSLGFHKTSRRRPPARSRMALRVRSGCALCCRGWTFRATLTASMRDRQHAQDCERGINLSVHKYYTLHPHSIKTGFLGSTAFPLQASTAGVGVV